MSATGAHVRMHAPRRVGGREALIAVAALLVGLTVGVTADRILSDRAASDTGARAAVVLPATGWATDGAALRTEVNRAMNAVLAHQAATEWTTSGAELREQVNRAMNEVLRHQAATEWTTSGAELREQVNRAMNELRRKS